MCRSLFETPIDGEEVALSSQDGEDHSLNGHTSFVWSHCSGGKGVVPIRLRVAGRVTRLCWIVGWCGHVKEELGEAIHAFGVIP